MTVEQKIRYHLEEIYSGMLPEGDVDEQKLRQAIEDANIADRAKAADRGRKIQPLILDEELVEATQIVYEGWVGSTVEKS